MTLRFRDEDDREILDVKPTILGGDPQDSSNKIELTRKQHIEAVTYWNKKVAELRKGS
jgi:hypothetical protein